MPRWLVQYHIQPTQLNITNCQGFKRISIQNRTMIINLTRKCNMYQNTMLLLYKH